MRSRRNGFTLIEAIVVIVVLGIISIGVGVSVTSSISAIRLESARWKLKNDIRYAQVLAVTQKINHGVIFTPASDIYSVYRQNVVTIVTDPATSKPLTVDYASSSDYKGVDLVSTGFGSPTSNRVEFNAYGVPSNGTSTLTADGTVTISYNGSSAVVAVAKNTGKVN